ncbi:hypothetical protein EMPS_00162 [Entomortierella parvispora]|uniref:Uncharacterized protein n=1 Tax=Entomortierella parvispora TaxID=205924 RepID=A0A9P3GZF9_9FUNG|nr:hypothetical protein EMPS_00162 [Entomortierella parvispora]
MTIATVSQSFRASPDGPVIKINALWDPKTNCHIVLWSRIQFAFENLQSVQFDDTIVSFMVNDDFEEILPLRIPYHPGVILEAIMKNTDAIPSTVETLSISDSSSQSPTSYSTQETVVSTGSISDVSTIPGSDTVVGRLVRLAVMKRQDLNRGASDMGSSQTALPSSITMAARSSLQTSGQLYESFLASMKTGQLEQAEALKAEFRQHFGILQNEMGENKGLQEEMRQMMTNMMELQRQANERLISIQQGIRAILTQTYELLEYPIPRLFIVLPKESSRLDILSPFTDKFRLFFLCECGEHTKSTNSKIPHHIHMAKHEGYDLDRPNEFFQKYGVYILGMLRMVKHGVSIAGYIVPPLAHLKLADGLDKVQKGLESVEANIEPHVDSAIAYLEKMQGLDADVSDGQGKVDQAQALEGAELRQVANFLKNRDEAMVLGNLYRMVTREGHVKWVCLDHYRENYNELALQAFSENVDLNGGKYDPALGTVAVTLKTASLAREFYGLLVKARNIQELTLTLDWSWTYGDLKQLRDTLQALNVAKISVNCRNHAAPPTDNLNRGKRYDPLAHIMMNTKIQSVSILMADKFFSRTSTFPKKPTPLREVSIESIFNPKSDGKNLQILVDQSSQLKTLSLKCTSEDFYKTVEWVRTCTAYHRQFQTLTVVSDLFHITLDSSSLRTFPLSSKLSASYKSDFRATVLAALGSRLDMYCVDDATTDLHIELLLAAVNRLASDSQLTLLRFNVGTGPLSLSKLGTDGQMHLKRLLQSNLPENCKIDCKIEYTIRFWSKMPWLLPQCTNLQLTFFDNGDIQAMLEAMKICHQERQNAVSKSGLLGSNHTLDRFHSSRLESLDITLSVGTYEQERTENIARMVRTIPGLKSMKLRINVMNKNFDPKTLMSSFDFTKLEKLHFHIYSPTASLTYYQSVVESVPTSIEGQWALKELIFEIRPADRTSMYLEYYTKLIEERVPGCVVVYNDL